MNKLIKIIFLFLLLSALRYPLNASYASVPHLINYQGKLTDISGVPLNGSYAITFRIYDSDAAGNLLWEEVHNGVVIDKGIFSLILGSVNPLGLAFDAQYYLEIKVGAEVMSPRQRIASVGYAIRAEKAEVADTIKDPTFLVPKGAIIMWSGAIANIPSGWALCDGSNGTPDLRDRFIVGARQDDGGVAKTNVTGSLTQSGNGQLSSHSHGVGTLATNSTGAHTHTLTGWIADSTGIRATHQANTPDAGSQETTSSNGDHSHTISGSTAIYGTGSTNIAVYFALAFIMKL